mmetsp:Transcript_104439/g.302178  ORF Transcript_104439/g.302178 Transcript_104439/m.302178 type:complete len:231 (+) Transcript_104439:2473-3165(+)
MVSSAKFRRSVPGPRSSALTLKFTMSCVNWRVQFMGSMYDTCTPEGNDRVAVATAATSPFGGAPWTPEAATAAALRRPCSRRRRARRASAGREAARGAAGGVRGTLWGGGALVADGGGSAPGELRRRCAWSGSVWSVAAWSLAGGALRNVRHERRIYALLHRGLHVLAADRGARVVEDLGLEPQQTQVDGLHVLGMALRLRRQLLTSLAAFSECVGHAVLRVVVDRADGG